MKKLILLLIIVIATSSTASCIPAAFVAGATAGGAVVYDRRSMQTIWEDKKITFEAQNRINSEAILKGQTHISVSTFNGVVLLVGQADSMELRERAYDLVKTIDHVRRVHNEIIIADPIPLMARSTDTWITTKVKAKLLAEKGLNSTQIKVITENGDVYLMGLVTRKQANMTVNVARQITGVQKVIKLFEYVT